MENRDEILMVIGEVLLDDPASEHPRIESRYKNITKNQLGKMIASMYNELKTSNVQMDLTPYQITGKYLSGLKTEHEFDDLMDEVLNAYD